MLTKDQKKYLDTIPEGEIFHFYEFDSNPKNVADKIVIQLKEILPNREIFLLGSLELGIGGQNDIDITVVGDRENIDKISSLFGEPKHSATLTQWEFIIDSYPVEIYLNPNSPEEHIETIKILSSNKDLLNDYEELKRKFDGKLLKEYMKAKYEFFNKILK